MEPMFSKQRISSRIVVLLGLFVVVLWASPMWFIPGKTGIGDWAYISHRFEASRLTVMKYGQWPGHNPWIMGGSPLLGNPLHSLLSVNGLLVLIFGTSVGLRLGLLVYLSIGFVGAWKLSKIWWKDRLIRLVFAFFVIANPALAYQATVGGPSFVNFHFMPFLFYFLLRFRQDKWSGLKAAIVFGLAFNDSPGYMAQYGALILVCVYAYLFIANFKEDSKMLLRWLSLFVPVCAAVTFYRLATVLPLALDYPRITNLKIHFRFFALLKFYLRPYTRLTALIPYDIYKNMSFPFELSAYTGMIAFFLFLFSFRRGIKWWHVTTILLVWATAGNDNWFYLMYWIQKIPSYSSHLCFTRIRSFALLFFGIGAVWGLQYLGIKCKEKGNRFLGLVFIVIATLMVAEPITISHLIMRSSHIIVPSYIPYGNPAHTFQNVSKLSWPEGTTNTIEELMCLSFRAIEMNIGVLNGGGNEAYLRQYTTIRVGRDEPGYVGEFHQSGKAVEPALWSPNRIILNGLTPDKPLTVNMNPGNPWYNNGTQLFPEYRIVELDKPFEVMPDKNGSVDLVYRHPGQTLGITGTILFLFISVIVIVLIEHGHLFKPCKARTRKGSLC
jgi:hypothetical protein